MKVQLPIHWSTWEADGSRKARLVGAGVYRSTGGKGIIILLGSYATILQGELIGIEIAAQLGLREEDVEVCIYALTA